MQLCGILASANRDIQGISIIIDPSHLVLELRSTSDFGVGMHFTYAKADKVLRATGERALINDASLDLIVHCRRIFIIYGQMPENVEAILALAARVGQLLADIEITSVTATVLPGSLMCEDIGIAIVVIQYIIGIRCVVPAANFPGVREYCRACGR